MPPPSRSRRRLPPLKALEAFDAAARSCSFQRAAEELHITPTAVSHRIRSLEEHVGAPLFVRLTRALKLTPLGKRYAEAVWRGFDHLRDAQELLGEEEAAAPLTVTATMSFATNWLGPRLATFREAHPDIPLRLLATDDRLIPGRDRIDVAIRYAHRGSEPPGARFLIEDRIAPVCAPGLLDPAETAADWLSALRRTPLLQYEWRNFGAGDPDWTGWWRRAEAPGSPPAVQATYSDEHLCLEDAAAGRGAALVSLVAADRLLRAGRLIAPFAAELPHKSYWLVVTEPSDAQGAQRAFADWILAEAVGGGARPDG